MAATSNPRVQSCRHIRRDSNNDIPVDFGGLERAQSNSLETKEARDKAIQIILEYERSNFEQCTYIYTLGLAFCMFEAIMMFWKIN